jgi:hypothetical protein
MEMAHHRVSVWYGNIALNKKRNFQLYVDEYGTPRVDVVVEVEYTASKPSENQITLEEAIEGVEKVDQDSAREVTFASGNIVDMNTGKATFPESKMTTEEIRDAFREPEFRQEYPAKFVDDVSPDDDPLYKDDDEAQDYE